EGVEANSRSDRRAMARPARAHTRILTRRPATPEPGVVLPIPLVAEVRQNSRTRACSLSFRCEVAVSRAAPAEKCTNNGGCPRQKGASSPNDDHSHFRPGRRRKSLTLEGGKVSSEGVRNGPEQYGGYEAQHANQGPPPPPEPDPGRQRPHRPG